MGCSLQAQWGMVIVTPLSLRYTVISFKYIFLYYFTAYFRSNPVLVSSFVFSAQMNRRTDIECNENNCKCADTCMAIIIVSAFLMAANFSNRFRVHWNSFLVKSNMW
jgi:hypothetical protein